MPKTIPIKTVNDMSDLTRYIKKRKSCDTAFARDFDSEYDDLKRRIRLRCKKGDNGMNKKTSYSKAPEDIAAAIEKAQVIKDFPPSPNTIKKRDWFWTHFIIEAFCGYEFMHTKTMQVSKATEIDGLFKELLSDRNRKYKRVKNSAYVEGRPCKDHGRPDPDRCLNMAGRHCPFFLWSKVDKKEYKAMLDALGKLNESQR